MTIRSDSEDAARRAYLGVTRGTLVKADDKLKLQEVTVRARFGEQMTSVEHWHPYGFTSVPNEPTKDGEAEVLLQYLGGSPDHPVVVGIADRRSRPKDLKPGDVAHHDSRGNITTYHKDGITKQSPFTITHQVVDKGGKIKSSVVQSPDGKVAITNDKGATIMMDGPNIMTKPGAGGKHVVDGDVEMKGGLTVAKTIAGVQGVTSGGLPVRTS